MNRVGDCSGGLDVFITLTLCSFIIELFQILLGIVLTMRSYPSGYTILDNVLFVNGTLFLVSDQVSHGFPKVEEMISNGLPSPYPAVKQDLMFLTRYQTLETIGYNAHR